MRRYAYKKQYKWSAPIAYSVGLIASDGCLSKDGRHIDLTSVDTELLEHFCDVLQRPRAIKMKIRYHDTEQQAYRVQLSDVAYYDFLLEAGLVPRKSRVLSEIIIPDVYWTHFLRGLFDGDGSFYGYRDRRWRSSFMYYMVIASASCEFLEYIRSVNKRLIGSGNGSIRRTKGVWILSYAKQDTRLIASAMYADVGSLCLGRKKTKLEAFLKEDSML